MAKSAEAFRTISEVADWLGSPAHVLRFWESKFSQVKPVKRAGGRRYYRPADMLLLGGIKKLLHDDGMTIKGVQKVLREQGVKYVSDLSPTIDEDAVDTTIVEGSVTEFPIPESASADSAQVLQFQREQETDNVVQTVRSEEPATETPSIKAAVQHPAASEQADAPDAPIKKKADDDSAAPIRDDSTDVAADPVTTEIEDAPPGVSVTQPAPSAEGTLASDTTVLEDFAGSESADTPPESDRQDDTAADAPDESVEPPPSEPIMARSATDKTEENRLTDIPAFLSRPEPALPRDTAPENDTGAPADVQEAESEAPAAVATPEPPPPRPAIIQLPPDPADDAIDAPPGLLKALAARRGHPLHGATRAAAIIQRDKLSEVLSRQNTPRRT